MDADEHASSKRPGSADVLEARARRRPCPFGTSAVGAAGRLEARDGRSGGLDSRTSCSSLTCRSLGRRGGRGDAAHLARLS
eukprot:15430356-Alexandrium_andersonii.AAC.1